MTTITTEEREALRAVGPLWWISVAAGVLWVLWGLFVLSYKPGALASLAVLIGISFILGGVNMLVMSRRVHELSWVFVVGGVLGIIAGVIVFFQPGHSLYVIAVFVAWYLAFAGVFTIIGAFVGGRHDWWWMGLILGLLEVGLGVWAIGSPLRQVLLLVNLVGFGMMFFGINEIFAGFAIRSRIKQLDSAPG